MPVFLDEAAAPSLDALLAGVHADGLTWQIDADTMPAIAGIGTLGQAGPREIAFLANPQYASQLATTQAGAVILSPRAVEQLGADAAPGFARVVCAHPYLLYARIAQWFAERLTPHADAWVHPSAVVAASATLADDVVIGPQAVVGEGVKLARGVRVGAGCVIGDHCEIGPDTLLHARVTLYHGVRMGARGVLHAGAVIGADGFGFAPDAMAAQRGVRGQWVKIPQLGAVRIGDDVEIGANTTIDRGALDDTVIGHGVKLDNQIMIGHNVQIGEHTAMAGCVGVAGSTRIGARCIIGGAAMISGHLTLADDVVVSGGTVVAMNLDKPGQYTAIYPLLEHGDWQRNAAVVPQLSRLRRRVQALERTLAASSPASPSLAD